MLQQSENEKKKQKNRTAFGSSSAMLEDEPRVIHHLLLSAIQKLLVAKEQFKDIFAFQLHSKESKVLALLEKQFIIPSTNLGINKQAL